jgi:hypothetical protein
MNLIAVRATQKVIPGDENRCLYQTNQQQGYGLI